MHALCLAARNAVLALVSVSGAMLALSPALAAYPDRPVRMIVPFAPGGAVDVVGRIVAQKLTEKLGQSFYIENIAGAAGNIGTAQAARATPDGTTLLCAFSSHVVNPSLFQKLSFDPVADFEPITLGVIAANVIVVNKDVAARSVAELVSVVKANPGKFSFAATTNTQAHLLGVQFRRKLGLDLVHVPFNGAGPAIQAVVGGHTPVAFATLASAISQIQGGQLRALAMLSVARIASLPDVPTMAEAGHPDINGDVWIGFLAPAKTPDAVTELLNREIAAALTLPEVKRVLAEQGLAPAPEARSAFAQRIRNEIPLWRKIIDDAKIGKN